MLEVLDTKVGGETLCFGGGTLCFGGRALCFKWWIRTL